MITRIACSTFCLLIPTLAGAETIALSCKLNNEATQYNYWMDTTKGTVIMVPKSNAFSSLIGASKTEGLITTSTSFKWNRVTISRESGTLIASSEKGQQFEGSCEKSSQATPAALELSAAGTMGLDCLAVADDGSPKGKPPLKLDVDVKTKSAHFREGADSAEWEVKEVGNPIIRFTVFGTFELALNIITGAALQIQPGTLKYTRNDKEMLCKQRAFEPPNVKQKF